MAFSGAPSHWKDDTSEQGQSSKALLLLLPRSAFARFGGRGQGHGHRRRRRRNPTDDKSLFGRGRSNGADWSDRPSLVFVTSQQEGQHVCRSTRSLSLSLFKRQISEQVVVQPSVQGFKKREKHIRTNETTGRRCRQKCSLFTMYDDDSTHRSRRHVSRSACHTETNFTLVGIGTNLPGQAEGEKKKKKRDSFSLGIRRSVNNWRTAECPSQDNGRIFY